jgi:lysophospholipase L1-like esterase
VVPVRSLVAVVVLGALAVACDVESTETFVWPTLAPGAHGQPGDAVDRVADGAADVDAVVMIGDSITRGSRAALEDRFGLLGMQQVIISAENNKRIAVSLTDNPSGSAIAQYLTDPAANGDRNRSNELWIVALGTNDVGKYDGPEEIAAAVNEVLDAVPAESPLIWVETYFRDRPDQAAQVNAIVADRVIRRGNGVIAPWTFFAPGDGVLHPDGVHPTPGGTEVFAFVVSDTARAFLGR